MKIALYATTILEHGGGLEKYLIETAKNLSELPGFQVDVITMDNEFTEKIAKILGFYYFKKVDKSLLYKESSQSIAERLGKARYYKCRDFKELKAKFREYDVVYSKNELLEAFILKFFIGYRDLPPIIFGCHTPVYYPVTDSFQSKLHNFIYGGFIYKFLTSGVSVFHTLNLFEEVFLKSLFPKKKVVQIYNPFDFDDFVGKLNQHKESFLFKKSKFNIVWVGRLTEQKGVDDLIEIIDSINKTPFKEKIEWNIAGDGDKKLDVLNLSKRWNNVNYFGHVENNLIANIYENSQLFISTSKWESFGFNIIEAQTFGLPVIAYNIPGPQDIIEDSKNGFLVENKNNFIEKLGVLINGKTLSCDIEQYIRLKFNKDTLYNQLSNLFKDTGKEYGKRISHVLPAFYTKEQYSFEGISNIGGGERYAAELGLSISRFQDTTLITFGESDHEFKYKTLNIRIIKCAPFLRKFNGNANFICFKLFKILKNFDIIHTYQYYTDTTLFVCLFGILTRKKVFVTDLGFRGINISRYIPMKYLCDKVLILTAYEKQVLGVTDNQFEVIYGGIDLERYSYSGVKKKQVMFIGRLLPHKGVNYLIEALDSDVECIVAGHRYDEKYFALLQQRSRGKKVKFLLSASDEEIISHLKESSILVLPSVDVDVYGIKHKNAELFGLVVAESFACGTPVIVTDSSALPYVVDDGVNGFVVPQNSSEAIREKIDFLFSNEQEVLRMGKNGRDKVERIYNWENVARLCIKNYLESR